MGARKAFLLGLVTCLLAASFAHGNLFSNWRKPFSTTNVAKVPNARKNAINPVNDHNVASERKNVVASEIGATNLRKTERQGSYGNIESVSRKRRGPRGRPRRRRRRGRKGRRSNRSARRKRRKTRGKKRRRRRRGNRTRRNGGRKRSLLRRRRRGRKGRKARRSRK